jgi:hypothetical protein
MEKITNNKRVAWLAGVFAGLLALVAIAMGVLMTFSVMVRVLPGNLFTQILAIAFFDAGALGWLGVYIYKARGTPQRAVSLWLCVWDLAGVVAMVIAEILLGGQELVNIPPWLGKFIIDTVIITFALNLIGWYYLHANAPETREAINAQDLEDDLIEIAERQARASIEREAQALGALLAGRVTSRIKYRMRLPMSEDEAAQWRGEIVDAETIPQPALPAPTAGPGLGVWNWLKSFLQIGMPAQVQQSELTTPLQNLEPSLPGDQPQQPDPDQNPPT